jgi:hypothetical protein
MTLKKQFPLSLTPASLKTLRRQGFKKAMKYLSQSSYPLCVFASLRETSSALSPPRQKAIFYQFIESRRTDISVATVPRTSWQNGMLIEAGKVPGATSGVTTVLLRVSLGLKTSVRCSEWRKARASSECC